MDKKELSFQDFLGDVDPSFESLLSDIHNFLIGKDCGIKLQLAKSGHVVSYSDPTTTKTIANFVSRKKGPVIRFYGSGLGAYDQLLDHIPQEMKKVIEKASVCKRMINPTTCNSKCSMGYEFVMDGENYQKCKYNLMFPVTPENNPFVLELLEKELEQRTA